MLPKTVAFPEAELMHDFICYPSPMLVRKELLRLTGDLGLSCSLYTGGGIASLEDCKRGLESSSWGSLRVTLCPSL